MRALPALVACLAALLAGAAHAARPFVTDDARVVDKDHCQIETFYKKQRTYAASEFWWVPACNPAFVPTEHGLEVSFAAIRQEDHSHGAIQAKYLFKELKPNGFGLAGATGFFSGQPYVNAIASFSFLDDRAVLHANAGRFKDDGSTWGLGLETLLYAPRVYGILETYGQRGQAPTYHYGIRFWVVPNQLQVDATRGDQGGGDPDRRFYTLGFRVIF